MSISNKPINHKASDLESDNSDNENIERVTNVGKTFEDYEDNQPVKIIDGEAVTFTDNPNDLHSNEDGQTQNIPQPFNNKALTKHANTYDLEKFEGNLLLIFNHKDIEGKEPRLGTEADVKSLTMTFEKFGFHVTVENDLTKEEIFKKMRAFSRMNFTNIGCIAVAILTHGENGVLMAKNGKYSEMDLWDYFKVGDNLTLVTKPRILIVQACRGDDSRQGVPVKLPAKIQMDDVGDRREEYEDTIYRNPYPMYHGHPSISGVPVTPRNSQRNNNEEDYCLPEESDIIILHSASIGKKSCRHSVNGSWFIQSLCDKVNELAATHDFQSILTEVKKDVAIDRKETDVDAIIRTVVILKQMPVTTSTLTRKLYFKEYKRSDTNYTPLRLLYGTCSCNMNHTDYLWNCLSISKWITNAENNPQLEDCNAQDMMEQLANLSEYKRILNSINATGPQLCQISRDDGASCTEGVSAIDNRRFDAIAERRVVAFKKSRWANLLSCADKNIEPITKDVKNHFLAPGSKELNIPIGKSQEPDDINISDVIIVEPKINHVNKELNDIEYEPQKKTKPVNTRPLLKNAHTYELESFEKKVLLIFNHKHILGRITRLGTEKDVEALTNSFKNFGFSVEVYNDLTKDDIFEKLEKFSSDTNFSDYGCLAIAVLTHGRRGEYFANIGSYTTEDILAYFNVHDKPTLVTKPRILIVQACRLKESLQNSCDQRAEKIRVYRKDGNEQYSYYVPEESDILILQSSYIGKVSFRHTIEGSWFIQSLCDKINELAATHDLESILTEVKKDVAIEKRCVSLNEELGILEVKKQMPVVTSSLIRKLYLKNYGDKSLSLASAKRNNMPSTSKELGSAENEPLQLQYGLCSCNLDHIDHIRNCLRITDWMSATEPRLKSSEWSKEDIRTLITDLIKYELVLDKIKSIGPQLCQFPAEDDTAPGGDIIMTRHITRFVAITERVHELQKVFHGCQSSKETRDNDLRGTDRENTL